MTALSPQQEERRLHRAFVVSHAESTYREPLQALHAVWSSWNVDNFAGRLALPHIGFGPTAPRVLALRPHDGLRRAGADHAERVADVRHAPGRPQPWPADGMRQVRRGPAPAVHSPAVRAGGGGDERTRVSRLRPTIHPRGQPHRAGSAVAAGGRAPLNRRRSRRAPRVGLAPLRAAGRVLRRRCGGGPG